MIINHVFLSIMIHFTLSKISTFRDSKFLSLFTIVRFPNDACNAGNKIGTCYTKQECLEKGGKNDGSCASGYGVCCTFSFRCGGNSRENNTYFESSTNVNTGDCRIKICPLNYGICQLRLNFEAFSISGPNTDTDIDEFVGCGINGQITNAEYDYGRYQECKAGYRMYKNTQCTKDTFSVTNPRGISPPTLCGNNEGKHMYVDSASSCNDLLFVLNSRITAKRSWNIRIIQYHCNHGNLAPKGCTEYYFDTKGTGTVSSYNWNNGNGNHLANQNQLICIRRESGFCRICYITEDARDISISGGHHPIFFVHTVGTFITMGCCGYGTKGDNKFITRINNRRDCIIIDGLSTYNEMKLPYSNFCGNCGPFLSSATSVMTTDTPISICSKSQPFHLTFSSNSFEGQKENLFSPGPNMFNGDRGFKLVFKQDNKC